MAKILQFKDKKLRKKSDKLSPTEIGSLEIKKIIENMSTLLKRESDGVAIAAPQIGELYQIFVISSSIYKMLNSSYNENKDKVYINPKIIRVSKEMKEMEEGCLSVRYFYGAIERHEEVEIEALDEEGRTFREVGRGLLAQIFQHEIDHLYGTLFIDTAKNIYESLPEKN